MEGLLNLSKEMAKEVNILPKENTLKPIGETVTIYGQEEAEIIGYNKSEAGFYPGSLYPYKLKRKSDGYIDVYSESAIEYEGNDEK